ncbi:MAG: histidine triad nucleotide-binding protein [Acidobacteriota bacterium]
MSASASGCLFCRIVRGEIPAKVLFEDDRVLAFEDVRPQAPVHFLVIPKEHFSSLDDIPGERQALLGEILLRARTIARDKGVSGKGYRIVLNTGAEAGQSVFHIHFHILGGRSLGWPPG